MTPMLPIKLKRKLSSSSGGGWVGRRYKSTKVQKGFKKKKKNKKKQNLISVYTVCTLPVAQNKEKL